LPTAGPGETASIARTLSLSLAPTVAAAGHARAQIGEWLAQSHSQPALIEVSRLLVSELVTNSVRHARTTADAPVQLSASLHPTRLRIEISDAGTDGTVGRRPPRFSDGSGGFGLDLVTELSSAWGVERGPRGTTVWLELPLRARV
jgi:anti-sigma regulatory factor (Ser/Thr protein kinase)